MSANSSASPSNKLPKKEAEIFKSIVNAYETKQYHKGLKSAETILKKIPNHGETLAMKGLILNCMGRKDEAYDFAKIGLKNDLRSHVCWHVYGLLYRSDSNYKEAIKCYLNALRIDPNNQNILRDLSWLQIQMRDIAGFITSRQQILHARPTMRVSWIAYAVGNYMGEQYSVAYDVITKYQENISPSEKGEKYEESELILFQNLCLEKQGKYIECIQHFDTNQKYIVDKYSMKIKIAELLLYSEKYDLAREKWLNLVTLQSENYKLHIGLQCAYLQLPVKVSQLLITKLKHLELPSTVLALNESQLDILRNLYFNSTLATMKSRAIRKIKLTILQGEELHTELATYIRMNLSDGVPALYHDVCDLIREKCPYQSRTYLNYTSTGISMQMKSKLVEQAESTEVEEAAEMKEYESMKTTLTTIELDDKSSTATLFHEKLLIKEPYDFKQHSITTYVKSLLESYIMNLETRGTFLESSSTAEGEMKDDLEPPTALLWCKFLYCHLLEKSGDYTHALRVINECIDHTPTALDMYLKKAKILKKLFLFQEAADVADYARSLDLQDRYLNNKATKYLLRTNQVNQAMDTIAMFTKHDGDPQKTLFDLQANWYELELASSYKSQKMWGYALKKYNDIYKHFIDYIEDMFDFHNYSFRKTTLRMYLDAIQTQNHIYANHFFQQAAYHTITVYLHLIDCPEDIDGLGHLNAKDRKKEREKLKKKKLKEASANTGITTASAGGTVSMTNTAAEKDDGTQEAATSTNTTNTTKKEDKEDITGEKFLTKNFINECEIWCNVMLPSVTLVHLETLVLMAEVYYRKNKYIQTLRCIYVGLKKSPYHPGLNVQFIKLVRRIKGLDNGPKYIGKETIMSSMKQDIDELLRYQELSVYITHYFEYCDQFHSLLHILSKVKISILMTTSKTINTVKTETASWLLTPEIWTGRGITNDNILEVYKYLSIELKLESHAEQFRQQCIQHYPDASFFERDLFLPHTTTTTTTTTTSNTGSSSGNSSSGAGGSATSATETSTHEDV